MSTEKPYHWVSEVQYAPLVKNGRKPSSSTRKSSYPWDNLDAQITKGDNGETIYPSFFVTGKTKKQFGPTVYAASKRRNMRMCMTATEEECPDGVFRKGLRIYRIEDKDKNGAEPS